MSRLRQLTLNPAAAQADALMEQARQALAEGQRTKGRRLVCAALGADPNNARAWLMLAALASPHASLSYIHRALELRPHNPIAHAALEWAEAREQKQAASCKEQEASDKTQALGLGTLGPGSGAQATVRVVLGAGPKTQAAATRGGQLRQRALASWRSTRASLQIFAQNRLARFGLAIILLFAVMGLLQSLMLGTVWPRGIYNAETGFDTAVAPWPAGPSPRHLLGVDAMGRDILSMLMAATRPTFIVAITAALATAVVGTAIGAVSAYVRGPIDAVLYNFTGALYLLPAPVLMAIIGASFYQKINAVGFGLIYGVLAGGGSAAIVLRSHALTLMNKPYVDASRVAGAGGWHIITRHLVPHMLPLALVHMMLAVVGAVVADGFVAFFGLQRVRLNWGTMVYNSINYLSINTSIPWPAIVAPTVALSLFAAAFYMLARGLEDVTNPRLRDRV